MPDIPLVSPPAGDYPQPILVQLTAAPADSVYYTVDGTTTPTNTSTKYTSPISITVSTTVQAVSIDSANTASGVLKASYLIGRQPRTWTRVGLAQTLGALLLLYALGFGVYAIYAHCQHISMFGSSSSEIAMGLSGVFCVTGCIILAVLSFYLGDISFVLYCLLAEILGCGFGWLLGTYFSPTGSGESQQFQQIGLTVGTLLSGVVLSKVLRVVDTYLDPTKKSEYASPLILGTYFLAAAIFVSVTVYVDRAYGPKFSVSASFSQRDTSPDVFAREIVPAEDGICVVLNEAAVLSNNPQTPPAPTDFHALMQAIRSTNLTRPASVHWSLSPADPRVTIDSGTGELRTTATRMILQASDNSQIHPKPVSSQKLSAEAQAKADEKEKDEAAAKVKAEKEKTMYFGSLLGVNETSRDAYGISYLWIGFFYPEDDTDQNRLATCRARIDTETKKYGISKEASKNGSSISTTPPSPQTIEKPPPPATLPAGPKPPGDTTDKKEKVK